MPAYRTAQRSVRLRTGFQAVVLSLIVAASAQASVKFELAIHEAARAARRQNLETLLLVTRPDDRTRAGAETDGLLRAIEKRAIEALHQESGISVVSDATVRQSASRSPARQSMRTSEATQYLEQKAADAVLSFDFGSNGNTVRITLVDRRAVHFANLVELDASPKPVSVEELSKLVAGKPTNSATAKTTEPAETNAEATTPGLNPEKKAGKKPEKKSGPGNGSGTAGAGTGPKSSSVPFGPDGRPQATGDPRFGTGRRVARTGFNGDFVRATPAAIAALQASSQQSPTQKSTGSSQSSQTTKSESKESRQSSSSSDASQAGGAAGSTAKAGGASHSGGGGPGGKPPQPPTLPGDGGSSTTATTATSSSTTSSSPPPSGPGNRGISPLNEEILNFSVEHIGQQVGRGECWDLAAEALRAAGAEPARGYTFGDPVPVDQVQAGDILQFTSARFDEPGYYTTMGFPHHTAVVYSQTPNRTYILQQNFAGQRVVSTYDLNLNTMTQGTVEAYRPRPRQPSNSNQ